MQTSTKDYQKKEIVFYYKYYRIHDRKRLSGCI